MAGITLPGLSTGMDTATVIQQLMSIETKSQTKVKARLSTEQSNLSKLQDLNTRLNTLQSQLRDFAKPGSLSPVTSKSSLESVKVSAQAGATPASLEFTVNNVAEAHRLTFNSTAQSTDLVAAGGVKLTVGGVDKTVNVGTGSLADLAKGINDAKAGVTATTVTLDNGTQRLLVTADSTGAAGAFTLKKADGSDLLGGATVRAGADAEIAVGNDLLHSATNDFTKVLSGVTISVTKESEGQTARVNVGPDSSGAKGTVKTLVDALNSAMTQMDTLTNYDPVTKKSGALSGDQAIRGTRNGLLNSVFPAGGGTLADMGIQMDKAGKLVFDEAKFTAAFAKDAAGVAAALGAGTASQPGFAARAATVIDQAINKSTGTLVSRIDGENNTIRRLTDDVAKWDQRLALRQATLQKQFTNLEKVMSKFNSTNSWLNAQLARMNKG